MNDQINEEKFLVFMDHLVANPDKILAIHRAGSEYYFQVKQYYFSMIKKYTIDSTTAYSFFVYRIQSNVLPLSALALRYASDYEDDDVMAFRSENYRHNQSSFERLYDLLQAKDFGMDAMFDDIMK